MIHFLWELHNIEEHSSRRFIDWKPLPLAKPQNDTEVRELPRPPAFVPRDGPIGKAEVEPQKYPQKPYRLRPEGAFRCTIVPLCVFHDELLGHDP